ncbi:hypothetical protein KOI35_43435 [Actinoplanes bogorensis]|uniref:Saccharopine dehydrogenase NADP binding domain-containing protein n=1 Tax=Paractinoplanes bogorensis TaxID=1610840 RepID=A0ABS5Z3V4_9ACTN|nr:hypothetical protein [Actinoplanes bogorensis]MBU2670377.1 hypothetical protein [Actinoplanes bogorensis]
MSIWILGARGRIGRAVATRLREQGIEPVLIGRETEIVTEIGRQRPEVVVNTIGDYAATALTIARAGLPHGGHYLDVANDLVAVPRMLAAHDEAAAAGSTFVTGAGFGVLATESVVVKLCEDRPTPSRVRVDALASVGMAAGVFGQALAATTLDVLTSGGRRFSSGRLVSSRLGAGARTLALPDGTSIRSAEVPSGELLAARAASNAPDVTVTSALAPGSPVVRALLPAAARLLAIPPVRRFAQARMAAIAIKDTPRPRPYSWGHAVVEWPDGTTREGWLRAGDGMDFTAAVLAEAAVRLHDGEGKPGAYTPAAALGPDLAVAAGGTFVL